MTDPLKDLEARAEEYGKKFTISFPANKEEHEMNLGIIEGVGAHYIAAAREQHEITRKATIDEVLRLLGMFMVADHCYEGDIYREILKLQGEG